MKINELTQILEELAAKDLEDGANLNDHPCSLAVKAINYAFNVGYCLGYDFNADIDDLHKQRERFKSEVNI